MHRDDSLTSMPVSDSMTGGAEAAHGRPRSDEADGTEHKRTRIPPYTPSVHSDKSLSIADMDDDELRQHVDERGFAKQSKKSRKKLSKEEQL